MEQTSDYYDIKNVQLKFFYQLFEKYLQQTDNIIQNDQYSLAHYCGN